MSEDISKHEKYGFLTNELQYVDLNTARQVYLAIEDGRSIANERGDIVFSLENSIQELSIIDIDRDVEAPFETYAGFHLDFYKMIVKNTDYYFPVIKELQEKIFAIETNNKKLVEELKHKKEYDQQDIQEKVYDIFNAIEPVIKEAIIKVLCE